MSILTELRKKTTAVGSAFKAGWIATRCSTGCVIDDVNEEIIPCFLHKAEIARLAVINEEATQ